MNTYIRGLMYQTGHPLREQSNRLSEKFKTDVYKEQGVLRWKSNRRVPPQDILEFWKHVGHRFDIAKTTAAGKREYRAFMEQYTKNQTKQATQEQRNTMIGAFGKGETVIDVLTGRRTHL